MASCLNFSRLSVTSGQATLAKIHADAVTTTLLEFGQLLASSTQGRYSGAAPGAFTITFLSVRGQAAGAPYVGGLLVNDACDMATADMAVNMATGSNNSAFLCVWPRLALAPRPACTNGRSGRHNTHTHTSCEKR